MFTFGFSFGTVSSPTTGVSYELPLGGASPYLASQITDKTQNAGRGGWQGERDAEVPESFKLLG